LARQEPSEKTYEITLKLAQQSGLPAPMAKTNSPVAKASSGKSPLVAVAGTNSTVAAAKEAPSSSPALEGDLDEDKPPAVDAALIESEHILMDYVSLWPKGNLATAGQSSFR
jgi:hypothetical protein